MTYFLTKKKLPSPRRAIRWSASIRELDAKCTTWAAIALMLSDGLKRKGEPSCANYPVSAFGPTMCIPTNGVPVTL